MAASIVKDILAPRGVRVEEWILAAPDDEIKVVGAEQIALYPAGVALGGGTLPVQVSPDLSGTGWWTYQTGSPAADMVVADNDRIEVSEPGAVRFRVTKTGAATFTSIKCVVKYLG